MISSGHRVVFDKRGSYIEDPISREVMKIEERNGMFVLKLWTKTSETRFLRQVKKLITRALSS